MKGWGKQKKKKDFLLCLENRLGWICLLRQSLKCEIYNKQNLRFLHRNIVPFPGLLVIAACGWLLRMKLGGMWCLIKRGLVGCLGTWWYT
jgi:hypothetical protein